jgi:hypothetical protein
MWTTVYIAIGHDWALKVKEMLENEGFIVKISYLEMENEEDVYEILGPKFESEDIQGAILELGIM